MMGRMFAAVFSFAVNIIIVRAMTESDYADYVTLAGLQLTLLLVVSLGLERTISRFASEGTTSWPQKWLSNLLESAILLRLAFLIALAFIFTLASNWLALTFHLRGWANNALAFWVYTIAFGIYELLQIAAQCFMLQRSIRTSLAIQWGGRFFIVIAILLLHETLTLIEVLWIFAITASISCITLVIPINNHVRSRPLRINNDKSGKYNVWPIINLAWHNYLEKLASIPTSAGFFRLIAANSLPATSIASYGFYQMLSGIVQRYMPTTIVQGMLEPAVAGRYATGESSAKIGIILSAVFKINLIVLAPILGWLIICGGDLIGLLTGGKYVDQAWALALVTLALVPGGLWQILIAYANAISKSSVLAGTSVYSALLVIPLIIAVNYYPEHGLLMLAAAAPLLGAFQSIMVLINLNKIGQPCLLDFNGIARICISIGLSTLSTYLLINLLALHSPIIRMATALIMVGSFFIYSCVRLSIFKNNESEMLTRLIPRFGKILALFNSEKH
jgi:O-antigen/teichoic acid export membrane protein